MLTDAEEADAGNPDANQQKKEAKGGKRGKEGKAVAAASAALRAAVKQARSVVKGAQAEARLAELSEQMLQLVAQPQPQSKSTAAPQNAKSDGQSGGKKSSGTQMGKVLVPAHSQTAALRSAQSFCGCCTRWFCLRSWCWPCSSALNSALLCAPLSLQDEFVILGVIVVTVVLWIVPSVAKKVIDCPAHDRFTSRPSHPFSSRSLAQLLGHIGVISLIPIGVFFGCGYGILAIHASIFC
jgi:hypothetical protein